MIHVLLVDDSRAMRAFLRRILSFSGLPDLTISEVADGRQALQLLFEKDVDLIITDMNMPEMDGEAFLAELASDKRGIPIVVVSSDGSAEGRRRVMALGASSYIEKPFSPELLGLELERVLHTRSASC